jgi:hypothetical protein
MIAGLVVFAMLPAAAQAPARPLTIVAPILQQYEDGPPLTDSHLFIPGEMVAFSFQVQGYRTSPAQRLMLTYRIAAVDSDGVLLAEPDTGKIDTEVTEMDKDWMPKVRYSVFIPSYALSGKFRIRATVRDELGAREATTEALFTVRSRPVELSETLAVRSFRFLRGEEDRNSLIDALYKPGETLWARFDITGFKRGEKNLLHVVYSVAIADPSGKVVFSQADAAVEKDAPFYPQRYVPATFSLNVQPKTAAGEYTLIVSARDEIGGQTCESRQKFRVE